MQLSTAAQIAAAPLRNVMYMPAPAHEHAIGTDDLIDIEAGMVTDNIWLAPELRDRLADTCPGCAYQKRADDYADARVDLLARLA